VIFVTRGEAWGIPPGWDREMSHDGNYLLQLIGIDKTVIIIDNIIITADLILRIYVVL
jgi:hypothetical protein